MVSQLTGNPAIHHTFQSSVSRVTSLLARAFHPGARAAFGKVDVEQVAASQPGATPDDAARGVADDAVSALEHGARIQVGKARPQAPAFGGRPLYAGLRRRAHLRQGFRQFLQELVDLWQPRSTSLQEQGDPPSMLREGPPRRLREPGAQLADQFALMLQPRLGMNQPFREPIDA